MQVPRILLVEDDPDVREITALILESHGFDVVVASSGEEAIAAAKLEDIDAALIDLGLPDMNGRELALQLRDYPVAILTGADVAVDVPGASIVLQKPLAPDELIKAVKILLESAEDYEVSA